MEDAQKRRLYMVSSCLTIIWILIHIWSTVTFAILELTTSHSWDDYIIFVSIQVNGDLYFHSLIWISLLIIGSYYECQNCFNSIEKKLTLRTERDATLPSFVMSRAIMIKQSVSAVNMFSGFPLLITIGYIFIGFSGVLSLARNNVKGVLLIRVLECGYIVIYCLAIIALAIMVTVFRNKLESRKSALAFKLTHQNHEYLTVNWKMGLDTLCDPKLFEFSIMGLFSLDLSLILKFTASQITFTVLMLQLESSVQ